MSGRDTPTGRRFWKAVAGLGFTQIVAWGCVYYPVSVTGPLIARDLGLSQGAVYGAYSALLLASAAVAPAIGRAIDRRGGRPVLVAGCVVAALALLATASATSMIAYTLCSVFLGVAAAMTLYDAAFPAVVEATHPHGRRAITLVTFAGGFASTVCWPVTAFLVSHGGWRMTYVVYGFVMVLVCLPVNWFALEGRRSRDKAPDEPAAGSGGAPDAPVLQGGLRKRALLLLALTVSANQIVAAGFLIHIIDFSQKLGIGTTEAIALGMLFGPAQVLGRVGEMIFGRRFSAITTGRVAAAFLPLSLLCVLPGGTTIPVATVFVLAIGLSNGLMTIARGTVALSLFGPVGYGATMGKLTVPTLIARAIGPFLFAMSIESLGVRATVVAGLVLALLACLGMEMVASIERQIRQAPDASSP